MNIWKEFDVELINRKERDMGIGESFPEKITIDLSKVVAYYDNETEKEERITTVETYGGHSYNLFIEYKKFKNLMIEVTQEYATH